MARELSAVEARRLLSVAQSAEVDRERREVGKWPGTYNLCLIAEAANLRRKVVELELEGLQQRFIIRYDDERKSLYVKPEQGFVPCGWFPYDKLKYALTDKGE